MKLDFNTLGIDIGSTTVKIAILNKDGEIIFSDYQRPVSYTHLDVYKRQVLNHLRNLFAKSTVIG